MKVQLILEGGGLRVAYTTGVLDFFMDHGFVFENVIGVSAGAGVGTDYVLNTRGRQLNIFKKYVNDKNYISVSNYFKNRSYFGMDFIYHTIPEQLEKINYDDFNNSDIKLEVVMTNVDTGKPFYKVINNLQEEVEYVKASGSIPILAKIVELEEGPFLDGGISDAIPYEYSKTSGYDKQVIILTRDISYRKKKTILSNVFHVAFRKNKEFVEVAKNRYLQYNETIENIIKDVEDGKIIVIRPTQPLAIERYSKDISKIEETYNLGYNDAKNQMQEILNYVSDCENFKINK